VTMTTVGYGDLVPAANPGQTLAVVEALIGQLFLVVAVGKVINSFTPQRRKRSDS
jgi:voltage-gated potassium channel Kch